MARSGLWALLFLCAALAAGAVGCGEEGAKNGARVALYVSAPLRAAGETDKGLCRAAGRAIHRSSEEGDLRLRIVCLDAGDGQGRWTLARVGANARRATEDAAAIAYFSEPAAARRQSVLILEAADIADLGGLGIEEAMEIVLSVTAEGGQGDPRRAVLEAAEER